MKILLVNKFNFLKGGADKYFLELAELLKQEGHEVIKFCMQHPQNLPDKHEKFFVSYIDIKQKGIINKIRYAQRALYSFEAKRKFKALLKETKPDIIHIHNIYHQISPSILPVTKNLGIPVVMHLHDYKLISPNYILFNKKGIDTSSIRPRYYNCFLHKSLNNSYLQSFGAMIEMYLHHSILKIYEKNISLYLAPSLFLRDLMIKRGISAANIIHIPYFVKGIENDRPDYAVGDYFLFYGRLAKEKGVHILLKALSFVPDARLKIIGNGEEQEKLKEMVHELDLEGRIQFSQALYGENLKAEIKKARAIITPSIWYEVFGLVNIEAAALGKLVIASDIGGINESVKPGQSAWLFPAGNTDALATLLKRALENSEEISNAGEQGREFVLKNFTAPAHWLKLKKIYKNMLIK